MLDHFLLAWIMSVVAMEGRVGTTDVRQDVHVREVVEEWIAPDSTGLCGIHSLYVASRLLGCDFPLSDWIRPEYVTGAYGSTLQDLELAAREHGLEARPIVGLTVADLQRLKVPAILHVRPRGAVTEYVHWIAFLGHSDNKTMSMVDPQYGREAVSWEELANRFDGTALLVSSQNTDWPAVLWPIRLAWVMRALVGAVGLMLAVILLNRLGGSRPFATLAFVSVSVIVVSWCWNRFKYDGLLLDRTVLASSLATYASTRFPEVSMEAVLEVVQGSQPAALVDARYPNAFSNGTIPGAVNYPLDISLAKERRLVAELRSAPSVIVFCESQGCLWSDHIARRLDIVGIRNVSIYRAGHREWRGRSRVRENSTSQNQ